MVINQNSDFCIGFMWHTWHSDPSPSSGNKRNYAAPRPLFHTPESEFGSDHICIFEVLFNGVFSALHGTHFPLCSVRVCGLTLACTVKRPQLDMIEVQMH